jgi:acyl-CoA synthetase (NDP forming)
MRDFELKAKNLKIGFVEPKLSDLSIIRLKESQLPEAALENPIDVMATAGGAQFRSALEVLVDDAGIDSIFTRLDELAVARAR